MNDNEYEEACREVDEMLPGTPRIAKGTESISQHDLPFHRRMLLPNGWRFNQLTQEYEKDGEVKSVESAYDMSIVERNRFFGSR